MKFSSSRAQNIYSSIRNRGKINYWIGLAEKSYMTKSSEGSTGSKWAYDGSGLREELKRQLLSSVHEAEDKDWDEVVNWLFGLATLATATK